MLSPFCHQNIHMISRQRQNSAPVSAPKALCRPLGAVLPAGGDLCSLIFFTNPCMNGDTIQYSNVAIWKIHENPVYMKVRMGKSSINGEIVQQAMFDYWRVLIRSDICIVNIYYCKTKNMSYIRVVSKWSIFSPTSHGSSWFIMVHHGFIISHVETNPNTSQSATLGNSKPGPPGAIVVLG